MASREEALCLESKPQNMTPLTKASLLALVAGALVLGMWLNNGLWRHRRLMWQLQAAVIGGAVGFVAGRFTAE